MYDHARPDQGAGGAARIRTLKYAFASFGSTTALERTMSRYRCNKRRPGFGRAPLNLTLDQRRSWLVARSQAGAVILASCCWKCCSKCILGERCLLLQALLDSHGVHSTDRHTLTVYGVESTDGVACDNETRRPSMHPFKMSPMSLCTFGSMTGLKYKTWSISKSNLD